MANRLINAKAWPVEKQQWYYLTYNLGDKRVHAFSKVICPNVNVIASLEFELDNYDVTVKHISHYATSTSLKKVMRLINFYSILGKAEIHP